MAVLIGSMSAAIRSILNCLGHIAVVAIWGISLAIVAASLLSGILIMIGAKDLKSIDGGSLLAVFGIVILVAAAALLSLHSKTKTVAAAISFAFTFFGFFGQNYSGSVKAFKPLFASADSNLWQVFFAAGMAFTILFLLSKLKR
ncbi:MAG: hypothetical protein HY044_01590 [Candidatus Woesebacteria bacterium]|nr:MAG: hypothetical protein HY044_01590 [Candidatus Woesebacteria bacterium]